MGFPTWLMRIDRSSRESRCSKSCIRDFSAPHAPEMHEVRFRSPASPLSLAASVDLGRHRVPCERETGNLGT